MNGVRKLLATWFFSGYFPVASGTFGTLAGIPLYLALAAGLARATGGGAVFWAGYVLFTAAFSVLTIWASGCGEEFFGRTDAGEIVIDEVAGFLVTMFLLPLSLRWTVLGFLAFRFFDVVKPWPARHFDRRVTGGLGVTMDDLCAGVYACMILHALRALWR